MSDSTKSKRPPASSQGEIGELERRLADTQAELQSTDERYETLLDQLPVGVYRTTVRGRILQSNPALARMLGYTVAELDQLSAEDVFAEPGERQKQLQQWQEDGGIVSNEIRFRRGDGTEIWIRDTGQAVAGEDGKVRYFDGIVEDITARKRAEQALKEERERLDIVLRSIGDGVLALDLDFDAGLVNPRAAQYLDVLAGPGWNRRPVTQLGGRPIEELIAPPAEGEPPHEIVVAEPRKRVFEVTCHVMRHRTEVRGWVLLLRDVTLEREIRRGADVQSRLAATGQLAAGVAHDFNNVLCGILANADMLERSPEVGDDARQRLGSIRESCEGAAMLVRQLLDFSRHQSQSSRPLDLAHAARAVMILLGRTLPDDIDTDLDALPDTYRVMADISGIQQILTNLVLNARDAMPAGGAIRLRIERRHLRSRSMLPFEAAEVGGMEPGDWVVLEVADTGAGIPPDVLPNIFEPFFTTKGPREGTGLGLSQVYGIVKQLGGHIDVQTEVGQGTTFTLFFPALEELTD
jgi:PAS domain S-box-containing protein